MLFLFFFSSRRRHTICALVTGGQTCALPICSDMMGPRRREAHQSSMTVMRKVVGTLKLLRSAQANKVAHKLPCAGWRHKDAIVCFFFAKFALPFMCGGLAVVLLSMGRASCRASVCQSV